MTKIGNGSRNGVHIPKPYTTLQINSGTNTNHIPALNDSSATVLPEQLHLQNISISFPSPHNTTLEPTKSSLHYQYPKY